MGSAGAGSTARRGWPDGTLLAIKEGAGLTVRPPDEPALGPAPTTIYGGLNVLDGATGAARDFAVDWSFNKRDYESGGLGELAVAADGQSAAFVAPNETLLVDLNARKLVGLANRNSGGWNGNIAVSPDGNWLAGQESRSSLSLWEIKRERTSNSGNADFALQIGAPTVATTVAYAPDGKLALGLD